MKKNKILILFLLLQSIFFINKNVTFENHYKDYLSSLTNEQLTTEIENLRQIIEQQDKKISDLKQKKISQAYLENLVNNVSIQHNNDINIINSNIQVINTTTINMKNTLDALNSTLTVAYGYYDQTYIEFVANKSTRIGKHAWLTNSIINVKVTVPDRTALFSYDVNFSNGQIFIIEPTNGNIYPIRLVDGTGYAWGTIPACSNCFMFGIQAD